MRKNAVLAALYVVPALLLPLICAAMTSQGVTVLVDRPGLAAGAFLSSLVVSGLLVSTIVFGNNAKIAKRFGL